MEHNRQAGKQAAASVTAEGASTMNNAFLLPPSPSLLVLHLTTGTHMHRERGGTRRRNVKLTSLGDELEGEDGRMGRLRKRPPKLEQPSFFAVCTSPLPSAANSQLLLSPGYLFRIEKEMKMTEKGFNGMKKKKESRFRILRQRQCTPAEESHPQPTCPPTFLREEK